MNLDVYPLISIDRSLGEASALIDIDYVALVDYMRERGFDDEQIASTVIIFKADKILRNGGHVTGRYFPDTKEIALYPLVDIERSCSPQGNISNPRGIENERFSKTLVHEIEHKAIDTLGDDPVKVKVPLLVGMTALAGAAIYKAYATGNKSVLNIEESNRSQNNIMNSLVFSGLTASVIYKIKQSQTYKDYKFKKYWKSREEVQCRDSESNAPKDLVIIELKSSKCP